MATSGFERIRGDLECPMCLETFKDPVTLNCGHSYCSKCMNSYVQAHPTAVARKILPCSECRYETKVPDPSQPMSQWMKQLKPSFTIKKLVEQVNQPAERRCFPGDEKCFLCNGVGEMTPAVLWCSECEMSFCKKCSHQHTLQPSSNDHHLDKLDTKSKRRRPLTIKCTNHKDTLKFHCRDCRKSICSTCLLDHRQCRDVVPVDSMLGEMKSYISHNEQKVAASLNKKQDNLTKLKSSLEFMESKLSNVVSKIRNTEKEVMTCVKEKFQKDVDEVNKCAEEEISRLKSEIEATEIDVDFVEQNSTALREVLETENSNDIYNTHEFCRSGSLFPQTEQDGRPEKHLVDLGYSLDLKRIKQMLSEVCKIKLNFNDVTTQGKYLTEDSGTLTRPVLVSPIDTKTQEDEETPVLIDITVMIGRGVESVIVTDFINNNVKCYHRVLPSTSQRTPFSSLPSVYEMDGRPWGITKLKDNKVMVAVPYKRQLVTLHVQPVLMRENTITTQKEYRSLEMMDNGQLVAGTDNPCAVDVLDVSGDTATTIRTLQTQSSVFMRPDYMTPNKQDGHIIVSDYNRGTVTCMTSEGSIAWTYSPPKGTRFSPNGVTTTQRGDVIVADSASQNIIVLTRSVRKIIFLTRSGVHKTDLLTSSDTEIKNPQGVHYDDQGYMYVTDSGKILIYKVRTI